MNDSEWLIKRYNLFKPISFKKSGRKKCVICKLWIHPDMEDCQPCGSATPIYSSLHKF